MRYSDGGQNFSDSMPADVGLERLQTSPGSLSLLAGLMGAPPATTVIRVQNGLCISENWQASSQSPWLALQTEGDHIQVTPDLSGLAVGVYTGEIVVVVAGNTAVPPVTIPVTLTVVDVLYRSLLPMISH